MEFRDLFSIGCVRAWLDKRRQKRAAIERALAEFRRTRGRAPIGAHVLRLEEDEAMPMPQ
jgi:hypothetical protein